MCILFGLFCVLTTMFFIIYENTCDASRVRRKILFIFNKVFFLGGLNGLSESLSFPRKRVQHIQHYKNKHDVMGLKSFSALINLLATKKRFLQRLALSGVHLSLRFPEIMFASPLTEREYILISLCIYCLLMLTSDQGQKIGHDDFHKSDTWAAILTMKMLDTNAQL